MDSVVRGDNEQYSTTKITPSRTFTFLAYLGLFFAILFTSFCLHRREGDTLLWNNFLSQQLPFSSVSTDNWSMTGATETGNFDIHRRIENCWLAARNTFSMIKKGEQNLCEGQAQKTSDPKTTTMTTPPTTATSTMTEWNGESQNQKKDQYAIIIDGGSTGSRMFIYKFTYNFDGTFNNSSSRFSSCTVSSSSSASSLDSKSLPENEHNDNNANSNRNNDYNKTSKSIEVIGSLKSTPGLSSFVGKEANLSSYLKILFDFAKEKIPPEDYRSTFIAMQATAGMRLLSEIEQEKIYNEIYQIIVTTYPEFERFQRESIGTLSGKSEGFYAVLSTNFLSGKMTSDLIPKSKTASDVMGALDLGGSSTQLSYQHVSDNQNNLDEDDFFIQSYLAYGVDTIKNKLYDFLIHKYLMDKSEATKLSMLHVMDANEQDFTSQNNNLMSGSQRENLLHIPNPCLFRNFEDMYISPATKNVLGKDLRVIFNGLGDAEHCSYLMSRMLWHEPLGFIHPHHFQSKEELYELQKQTLCVNSHIYHHEQEATIQEHHSHHPSSSAYTTKSGLPKVPSTPPSSSLSSSSFSSPSSSMNTPPTVSPFAPKKKGHGVNPVCGLDGIANPRLQESKFLAMSVYFFALDCVREILQHENKGNYTINGKVIPPKKSIILPYHNNWPRPNVAEIVEATNAFCSLDWKELEKNSFGVHRYTKDDQLARRCLEAVYIHTLLYEGFGFDYYSRNIEFVLNIDGTEVEWTLGYALANVPSLSL